MSLLLKLALAHGTSLKLLPIMHLDQGSAGTFRNVCLSHSHLVLYRVSVDWMVLAKHYWCKMLRTGSAKVWDATIVNPFPTSFILWVMHAIMKVNAILWVSGVNPPSPEINELVLRLHVGHCRVT